MSKRAKQKQVWVDIEFNGFLKQIIRRKSIQENHDFSFADITRDIIRCSELKRLMEEKLLKRRIKDEARLF